MLRLIFIWNCGEEVHFLYYKNRAIVANKGHYSRNNVTESTNYLVIYFSGWLNNLLTSIPVKISTKNYILPNKPVVC